MDPIVKLTPTCGLKGKVIKAADISISDARDIYTFLGVPYAEPPTGKLRFSKPQPLSLWDGVRDAKEFGSVQMV
jgi:carboxylesterase type B